MCRVVRAAVVTDQQTGVGLLSTLKVAGCCDVCLRSAGVLQRSGEGRRRLGNKETKLRSERAAGQEEEEEGSGNGSGNGSGVFLVSVRPPDT